MFNNLTSIIDHLKGCYKEDYCWFATYYLLCRQVIYAVDIGTDFILLDYDVVSHAKFPIMHANCLYSHHYGSHLTSERKLNMLARQLYSYDINV